MAAQIIFDQVGLSAGSPGARTDGLSNGAQVTVRNGSGLPCRVELMWVPPEDGNVVASLAQVDTDEWTFDPTALNYGCYTARLIENEGTPDQDIDIKVFGIRFPESGLLLPGLNERGDPEVNLTSSGAQKTTAAERSYNNEPYLGLSWLSWWKSQRDLYVKVEELSAGGGGSGSIPYETADLLRAAVESLDIGSSTWTNSYATPGDNGGGAWTIFPIGSYVHNGGTVIAAASSPTKAAVRQNYEEVDPRWFGVSVSSGDNLPAFQAAANLGLPMRVPKGNYLLGGKLSLTADMRGAGCDQTHLFGISAATAVVEVTAAGVTVEDIWIDGFNTADACLLQTAAGRSTIRKCRFSYGFFDGLKLGAGNNISTSIEDSYFFECGRYRTGATTTGAAGSTVLTLAGAPDLASAWRVRAGEDFAYFDDEGDAMIAAGLTPVIHEITARTSNTITITPALLYDVTGTDVRILSGEGINIAQSATNGSSTIKGCTFYLNVAAGIVDRGLFGAQVFSSIYEGNLGTGCVVGQFGNGGVRVVGASDIGSFYEGGLGGMFQFHNVSQGTIIPGGLGFNANVTFYTSPGSDTPNIVTQYRLAYEVPDTAAFTVVTETSTGRLTRFTGATPCVATIPSSAVRAWQPYQVLEFYQAGDGAVTMAAGGGVTLNFRDGRNRSTGPGAHWWARYLGADEWDVWSEGDSLAVAGGSFDFASVASTVFLGEPEGIVNASGAASGWTDGSGEGNDLTQATGGARPAIITWRGYPAIQGANGDFLQRATFTGGATGNTATALIVGEWGGAYEFAFDGGGGSNRFTFGSEQTTGAPCARSDLTGAAAPTIAAGTPFVALVTYDIAALLARLVVLSEGGVVWSATRSIPASTTLNGLTVGSVYLGTVLYWTGVLAHVQIVDGIPSPPVMAAMLEGCASKWSLDLDLAVAGGYLPASIAAAASYLVAGLPSALDNTYSVIVVRDGGTTGGPCLAVSNGTNWIDPATGLPV